MPREDAERWNQRYRDQQRYGFMRPRRFLVQTAGLLPRQGLALDVAMGLGGNAGFLLQRGMRVVGMDIAEVGVRAAKESHPDLMAFVGDLAHIRLPEAAFDLILNFYYLQRDLWPQFRTALRPGGMLVIKTLAWEMRHLQPRIDPAYLLEPGELRRAFSDWEILVSQEGWESDDRGHLRAAAGLVARKPYS